MFIPLKPLSFEIINVYRHHLVMRILGFFCGAVEVFALLGCCTALVGSVLLAFWDSISVPCALRQAVQVVL